MYKDLLPTDRQGAKFIQEVLKQNALDFGPPKVVISLLLPMICSDKIKSTNKKSRVAFSSSIRN